MITKWAPPLTCPINKTDPGHYTNDISYTVSPSAIYNPGTRGWAMSNSRTLRDLLLNIKRKPELGEPSTWYRLFHRRSTDKKFKKKRYPSIYIVSDVTGNLLGKYKTKLAALHALETGWAEVRHGRTGRMHKNKVQVGSYVWQTDEDWVHWEDDISEQKKYPIATKRCGDCGTICACAFWASFSGGKKEAWRTPHQVKIIKKKLEKAEKSAALKRKKFGIIDE